MTQNLILTFEKSTLL